MKRVKLWSLLSLMLLIILGVVILLTHSKIVSVIWVFLIIIFEVIEYRIKYITTCYKILGGKNIEHLKLNKFDSFIESFILKGVRKELKLDEKMDIKT